LGIELRQPDAATRDAQDLAAAPMIFASRTEATTINITFSTAEGDVLRECRTACVLLSSVPGPAGYTAM
jgi:hypothetical protein